MIQLLGRINANLAVYTGLVETARTNNRAGNPVGSSYLSEASSLMQQTILPDAQRLYEETSARVDVETTASTRIPGPVILVVLATLLFGAFANRWLAKRTRRRVNIGFVAGGLAVLIMLMWVVTALVISTIDSRSAKEHRGRVAQDRHHAGDHRAAGAGRRNAVADPARRRERPQAVLLPTHRHDAATAVRVPRRGTMRSTRTDLSDAEQLLERWRAADDRISSYIAVGNYQAATQVALGCR